MPCTLWPVLHSTFTVSTSLEGNSTDLRRTADVRAVARGNGLCLRAADTPASSFDTALPSGMGARTVALPGSSSAPGRHLSYCPRPSSPCLTREYRHDLRRGRARYGQPLCVALSLLPAGVIRRPALEDASPMSLEA